LLKVKFILAHEPLPQMTVDLVHPFLQFFTWNVLVVLGQLGFLDSIEKAGGQLLGVGLDQPNETI
jgi:hypothetical protein